MTEEMSDKGQKYPQQFLGYLLHMYQISVLNDTGWEHKSQPLLLGPPASSHLAQSQAGDSTRTQTHVFYCCCLGTKLCPTLYHPVDCSTPGFPVLHQLLEFAQTPVHRVGEAIQPSHPLPPPCPLALNSSHHHSPTNWL